MIYFSADLHLGHLNILKYQPARCFETIDEMDAILIEGINRYVKRDDELYYLGDFAWKASRYGHYRSRLKVRKLHVVKGNHDASSLRMHVSSLNDMVCRKFNEIKFHMTHYPLVSWRAREHGSIHLYGHSHGMMEDQLNTIWPGRKAMDVGVDCAFKRFGEWCPFSLEKILEILKV